MSAHTPGPWSVVRLSGYALTVKSDVQPGYFCEIRGACKAAHGDEGEANARLIAAAPDLLDAVLACFVNGTPDGEFDPSNPLTEAILRAAIKKARGE